MTSFFFLLSGEHPSLPSAELKAVLEAEGISFKIMDEQTQVLCLEAHPACVEAVLRRCGMTKTAYMKLFSCSARVEEILASLEKTSFKAYVGSAQRFAVRVKRVRRSSSELHGKDLEGSIGAKIAEKLGTHVDLIHPDVLFQGLLSDGRFFFGITLGDGICKALTARSPWKRPVFHPSTMKPKLARCLVNLSRAKVGDVVLDSFCGVGGILIEAGFLRCRVLGLDVAKDMVRGTRKNLKGYNLEALGLIHGDAINLPFNKVDRVVTDLPYGRTATTLKLSLLELTQRFLKEAHKILPQRGFICLAAPHSLNATALAESVGFKTMENYFQRVHKGLTRNILVLGKYSE